MLGGSTCLGVLPVWVFCMFGCSACLGVLHVWVFCLFGCSACLGVLPVWVFCLFGCSAWCLIRSIYNSLEVLYPSFFFYSNVVNMWPCFWC